MTKKRAVVNIVIIWIAGIAFAMPTLIFSKTMHARFQEGPSKGEIQRTLCLLKWPDGFPGQSKFDFVYVLGWAGMTVYQYLANINN